jgi:hypothetical protein
MFNKSSDTVPAAFYISNNVLQEEEGKQMIQGIKLTHRPTCSLELF